MEYKEKFIAFIDILGFKKMVEASVIGTGIPLADILEMLKKLGTHEDQQRIRSGNIFLPESERIYPDLDFKITQISDCVVISSEKSPVGLLNLVIHCSNAITELLYMGKMCRGYITCGKIYHTDTQFIGTGYQKALDKEQSVSAFKFTGDEVGTPFVEIDPEVCEYVNKYGDNMVKRHFNREIRSDGVINALFPFQLLGDKYAFHPYDSDLTKKNVKQSVQNNCITLMELNARIMQYVDKSRPDVVKKAEHYINALYEQLMCISTQGKILERLCQK